MTSSPVFVRGVGALTPLGSSWPETLAALLDGQSAVAPVRHFDVAGFPSQAAAAITAPLPGQDRRLAMAERAAHEAWRAAAVDPPPDRLGIFIGAESGRPSWPAVIAMAHAAESCASQARGGGGGDAALGELVGRQLLEHGDVLSPAAVASRLAAELGAAGPVLTVSLACASSSVAIAEALRAIRLGRCDVALAGGVGADVDPFMLAGFGLLGALSARGASCPFDVRRDGFVVGEGAVMMVLASERGPARVRLLGAGRSLDAHRLTAPHPQGLGALRAMGAALVDAGLHRVDYVQAHGTSTQLNDAVEARAIRELLGDDAALRVSSVKGALGHGIAAAGALGLACAVAAVADGVLVPTAGLTEPDPACPLPHVLGKARRSEVRAALVNAFAFGGANCTLAVGRA